MPRLPPSSADVIELADDDLVVVESVPRAADSIDIVVDEGELATPFRARRLSSPEVEADVIDDVLASLDAEVARVRASGDFLVALESIPDVPSPPSPPSQLPAPLGGTKRLPRVTAPPRSLRASVPPMIPPPPPSDPDLEEETTVYESTSPNGLLDLAAPPPSDRSALPSGPIFVRGTESSGSVAPVALPDTPHTAVIRRKKSYAKVIALLGASAVAAGVLGVHVRYPGLLPAAVASVRTEPVAARAVVAPLPAMSVGVGRRDVAPPPPPPPSAPQKIEEGTADAKSKPEPTVQIVHPKATTRLPDGTLTLGASPKPPVVEPKSEPKPETQAKAAPQTRPEPPKVEAPKTIASAPPLTSSAPPKRVLTPEQELAEAQLKASMK